MSRPTVVRQEVRRGVVHQWLSDGRHLVLRAWGWDVAGPGDEV